MEKKESNDTDLIPDGFNETKPAVHEEYYKLLLDMQIGSVKKGGGNPEMVTIEQREKLLEQAQTNVNTGHVDPKKNDGPVTKEESEKKLAESMEKSFKKYGNPSKGSQPSGDFEPDE